MNNKPLKFSDHKQSILEALQEKGQSLGINESVNLIDGFINQPIYQEFSGNVIIGGPTIPMIAVVGNSGRVYFFALKALLPNLEM